jgi:hypothetical protein
MSKPWLDFDNPAFPKRIGPPAGAPDHSPLQLTNQLQAEFQQYLDADAADRAAERAARLSEAQKKQATRQSAIDALGDALDRLNNNQETNQ